MIYGKRFMVEPKSGFRSQESGVGSVARSPIVGSFVKMLNYSGWKQSFIS